MTHRDRQHQHLSELRRQWRDLSDRITAIVEQLGVTIDAEQRLVLNKRRASLEAERKALESQIQQLEETLESSSCQTHPDLQVAESALLPSANPFGDVGRITDPDRFFDREELLRQIFEELGKGGNISLVGESQIGKSSLLTMVHALGPERLSMPPEAFVYLSMEWVDDEDDFYQGLCDRLGIESCRGYKLTRALRGRRYVLCLDEIEKMGWDHFGFTVRVRSQLRGLADGPAAPLKLVIASRSPLARLFPDSPELDSPLAGICHQLDVGPFPPDVARALLAQRLRGAGLTFTEDQINTLLAKSGGHPAKLQRAAADLYRRELSLSESSELSEG
jgi:hypothetical protein